MQTTRFGNKILYVQRYYCVHDEAYSWRFWFFGLYFTTRK